MNAAGLAVRTEKRCYEAVSRKNLGENFLEHYCTAPNINHGYRFSKAMTNNRLVSELMLFKISICQWDFQILKSKDGASEVL